MRRWAKQGFTIIEVVLVLAIAGMIFLAVFLGLPALQRSQRDVARKNDIAMVVAAIKQWQGNNRGAAVHRLGISRLGGQSEEEYDDNRTNMVKVAAIPNGPLDGYLSLEQDVNNNKGTLSSNTEKVMFYSSQNDRNNSSTFVRYAYDPKKPFTNIIRAFVGFKCPTSDSRRGSTNSGKSYIDIHRDDTGKVAVIAFLESGGYYCQDI